MKRRNILSYLKETKSKAILSAVDAASIGNDVEKALWQTKRAYVELLIRDFEIMQKGRRPLKRIFVSYNKRSGKEIFDVVKKELESTDNSFNVVTGFQDLEDHLPGDAQPNILERVMVQLARSTIFLGIFTKDMQVIGDLSEPPMGAPSVWLMEEKGMALAMGKPLVLMIEEGIHEYFWLKTTPEKVHYLFNTANFRDVLKEVVDAVKERYNEALLNSIS